MPSRQASSGSAASRPASGSRCYPIVTELAEKSPKVHFVISDIEPIEAFALLTNDDPRPWPDL